MCLQSRRPPRVLSTPNHHGFLLACKLERPWSPRTAWDRSESLDLTLGKNEHVRDPYWDQPLFTHELVNSPAGDAKQSRHLGNGVVAFFGFEHCHSPIIASNLGFWHKSRQVSQGPQRPPGPHGFGHLPLGGF